MSGRQDECTDGHRNRVGAYDSVCICAFEDERSVGVSFRSVICSSAVKRPECTVPALVLLSPLMQAVVAPMVTLGTAPPRGVKQETGCSGRGVKAGRTLLTRVGKQEGGGSYVPGRTRHPCTPSFVAREVGLPLRVVHTISQCSLRKAGSNISCSRGPQTLHPSPVTSDVQRSQT